MLVEKVIAEIRKFKNESIANFVKKLSPSGKDNYFLWKIVKRIRKSTTKNNLLSLTTNNETQNRHK